jgi:hypothetical protein
MKKLLIIFIFSAFNSYSQPGMWTWISGDSVTNAFPAFGTQGVPSVQNNPGAIYSPMKWKDKQGNFWIYGGWNFHSDLWKFNPSTKEWTWVKGNGLPNEPPVYGQQGVSNIFNTPGARDWLAVSWVDTSGDFWLFGGSSRNDIWRYVIATNEWTWMNGDTLQSSPGNHGIQGVPGINNVPGSRQETCSGWTDSLNNLWLFGGQGLNDLSQFGNLNDLMKYDISTNEWTWMSGSDNINMPGSYGIKGVSSPANVPGGRWTYTNWKDQQGNFWLMGGSYIVTNYFNDVWKYDGALNEWTWMAGTYVANDQGTYTTICTYDSLASPWSRMEHGASTDDPCGRFWLFGGCTNWNGQQYLNDLWIFDPLQVKWNWINGSNTPNAVGNFGVLGVPSPFNIPAARFGAVAWWGEDNRYYMFGGYRNYLGQALGDLWVYNPDTSCVMACLTPPSALFNSMGPLCPGTCTDFINLSSGGTSFQWSFPGSSTPSSTDVSPTNICYPNPGSYDVQLIATNATGSDTLLLNNYVTVYPAPPPQGITQNGDTLFAIAGASSYQWYFNGSIITGATEYFYVAASGGDYNVVATDTNGCEVEAVIFNVLASAQAAVSSGSKQELVVFPNPANETLNVTGYELFGTAFEISVYNIFGDKVMAACCGLLTVDCRLLLPGMYFLEISSDQNLFRTKFIKQ